MTLYGTTSGLGQGSSNIGGSSTALPNGPSDSISHVEWSGESTPNFVSCGSWDGTARIWRIQQGLGIGNYSGELKALYQHSAPVLTSAFSDDTSRFFVGGCDNEVRMYDLGSGSSEAQIIARHEQPIQRVCWNPTHNVVISGSWDGYIKMWDGKSSNPIWQHNVGNKIFALDIRGMYFGAADSARNLYMWDLKRLGNPPTKVPSALKLQSRSLGIFIDPDSQPGWGLGGIEGRCSIAYINEPRPSRKNFCFKCHRQQVDGNTKIYAVNAIHFLKDSPIFLTAGSDGQLCTWDKDARQKLKSLDPFQASISDARWNRTGNGLVAFSVSYDWHMGPDQEAQRQSPNIVRIAMLSPDFMRSGQKQRPAPRR